MVASKKKSSRKPVKKAAVKKNKTAKKSTKAKGTKKDPSKKSKTKPVIGSTVKESKEGQLASSDPDTSSDALKSKFEKWKEKQSGAQAADQPKESKGGLKNLLGRFGLGKKQVPQETSIEPEAEEKVKLDAPEHDIKVEKKEIAIETAREPTKTATKKPTKKPTAPIEVESKKELKVESKLEPTLEPKIEPEEQKPLSKLRNVIKKKSGKISKKEDPAKSDPVKEEPKDKVEPKPKEDAEADPQVALQGAALVKEPEDAGKIVKTYEYNSKNIPITINILKKKGEYVPIYDLKIAMVSRHTEIFLEKIRKELIREVNLGIVDITDLKKTGIVEARFSETIVDLLSKYFPDVDEQTMGFLTTYLIQRSLGLGKLELLRDDPNLEEIAINSGGEPIWVYQREFGWVKTTVHVESDDQTRHFASMIGRKVGRQLTVLEPLLDANLETGDRINATLMPISNKGNTITLRRFASKPWTITDLIRTKTMSAESASLVWLGIQYELSLLIAGGTASGKTSTLNALCNLFPPNHRIISIEDTREIKLPSFLHWVPMVTRLPNAEGKGEVAMLHLLVNALRQRPDRILVGEVRRKVEAEVLFEAIHTGHSVYATFHANNAHEAITRLTSPPIEVPRAMLPAISMILVQYRNRRTGLRRTFQIAEITEDGDQNVILQYNAKKDLICKAHESKSLMKTLALYTGMSFKEINASIKEKSKILKWMVHHNMNEIDTVGKIMAEYYTDKPNLMKFVNKNKKFDIK